MRTYMILKEDKGKYINVSSSSPTITALAEIFDLPLRNFYLSDKQIKMMLDHVV